MGATSAPDRYVTGASVSKRLCLVVASCSRCADSPPDGLEAWAQVAERGYEGLVGKDDASPYEGGPTRRWLKVKQKGWTVEEDRWQRRIFAGQTTNASTVQPD
jgi:hypothetical protein